MKRSHMSFGRAYQKVLALVEQAAKLHKDVEDLKRELSHYLNLRGEEELKQEAKKAKK